jgi:hypothetical protein
MRKFRHEKNNLPKVTLPGTRIGCLVDLTPEHLKPHTVSTAELGSSPDGSTASSRPHPHIEPMVFCPWLPSVLDVLSPLAFTLTLLPGPFLSPRLLTDGVR